MRAPKKKAYLYNLRVLNDECRKKQSECQENNSLRTHLHLPCAEKLKWDKAQHRSTQISVPMEMDVNGCSVAVHAQPFHRVPDIFEPKIAS